MTGRRQHRRLAPYLWMLLLSLAALVFLAVPALADKEPQTVRTSGATDTAETVSSEEPIVPRNDLSNGGELYRSECAACHAATGIGGALSFRDNAPPLKSFTALQVAAAIRGGPGEMPFYGPNTISDQQLEQIVTYVLYLQDPDDPGGAPIGRVGPVVEGLVAWLIGISAFVLGLMWIGDRRA